MTEWQPISTAPRDMEYDFSLRKIFVDEEERGLKEYNPKEVIEKIKEFLEEEKSWDCRCDRDFAIGRLQEYFYDMQPIFLKEGGI